MRPFIMNETTYSKALILTESDNIEIFKVGSYVIYLFDNMDFFINEHQNLSHLCLSVAVDLNGDNLLNILIFKFCFRTILGCHKLLLYWTKSLSL